MNNEKKSKFENLNGEVTESAIPKETTSVSTSLRGGNSSTSSSINVLGGVAKVSAKNTGAYPMKVRVIYKTYITRVAKEWSLSPGKSLSTGEFSLSNNTYYLQLTPSNINLPTSGSGTLTSVRYT